MSSESESAVLREVSAADRRALSDAFLEHRERLWRMVNFRLDRRLRSRVDPDDVLQEAYLNAQQRYAQLRQDGEHSIFIWFRMIVSQTLVDVYRRHMQTEMRDARREVPMHVSSDVPSTSWSLAQQLAGSFTSPSGAARRRELSLKLTSALETMDTIDQEIIALRHFEDLTNAEVAALLDLTPTAASNRYVRALARLRVVLEQLPGF